MLHAAASESKEASDAGAPSNAVQPVGGEMDSAEEPEAEIATLFTLPDSAVSASVRARVRTCLLAHELALHNDPNTRAHTHPLACVRAWVVRVQGTAGLLPQDSMPMSAVMEGLLSIQVPYIFTSLAASAVQPAASNVTFRTMRNFTGMEMADDVTKRALLDFSFCMATGDMDAAYKAVKLVNNETIWVNMAHMCVKTQRMDVAGVCFGNMGNVCRNPCSRAASVAAARVARVRA
ncbi:hypothetical protein EON67_03120 [archaeon]|nr:MAG: hypothetical protein EON67_03120 [archaeon]